MELIASRARLNSPAGPAGIHDLIRVSTTRHTEFIDLTDRLESLVAQSGIDVGFMNVQVLHTTAAIVLNEAEPLLLGDFEHTLDRVAPCDGAYRHDRFDIRTTNLTPDERVNGHAHCRALVMSASLCVNVADGQLVKGRWQRVLLAELDGPQARTVSVVVVGRRADAALVRTRTSPTELRFREALGR